MKKLITAISLVLIPTVCLAWGVAMMGGGVEVGGGYTSDGYIGFYNDDTDGTPDSNPNNHYTLSADATLTRMWTATRDGQLYKINFYAANSSPEVTAVKGAVWVGTTLKATVDMTTMHNNMDGQGWTGWSGELVAESGQSLEFSEDAVLYFGVTVDWETGDSFSIGREDPCSDPCIPNYKYEIATYDSDVSSWASSSSRQLGAILHYKY
jgi:hypothetical protein